MLRCIPDRASKCDTPLIRKYSLYFHCIPDLSPRKRAFANAAPVVSPGIECSMALSHFSYSAVANGNAMSGDAVPDVILI